ncbi:helix-turn-helix domain-containing protein [Nocardia niigatensis]
MPKDQTDADAINRQKRVARALQLRETGANYRQISQALDISMSTAHKYVKQAMAEIVREPAESVLQLELSRCDVMLLSIWKSVTKGDLQAIDRALRIMDRRAKLTGVDQLAAQKIAQDGKELPAVDAWLAAMLGDDDATSGAAEDGAEWA